MAGSNQRRRQWETRIARWRASGAVDGGVLPPAWLELRDIRVVAPAVRAQQSRRRALTLIPVVAPISSGGAITIRLPSGIGIEVESGFDAGVLSAVVRTLQVTPPC